MTDAAEKVRCQSCGMPVMEEAYVGTHADGSRNWEYCTYCFKAGALTQPNQTLEEMIQSSIGFMSSKLGYAREEAERLSREVIPRLKRWK